MANAIELIKSDHKKVAQLYQRYQGSNAQPQLQQALIQEMCQELTIHAQLEEEIFYPAVERQLGKEGANLVTEARKEHREMKRAMSQLQAQGTESWRARRLSINSAQQSAAGHESVASFVALRSDIGFLVFSHAFSGGARPVSWIDSNI
jgi:hemerythrin superfamily protein